MVDFFLMDSQWTFEMMKLHLSCKNCEKCELKKMSYDVKNNFKKWTAIKWRI